jgi:hypothetical protein
MRHRTQLRARPSLIRTSQRSQSPRVNRQSLRNKKAPTDLDIESKPAPGVRRKKLAWPVSLFLISLIVPWTFQVGPARMSAYRFVLLGMLVPMLFTWASGKAGRVRATDIALLLFSLWSALGLIVLHGFGTGAQPSGILFIETFGAYLLARCYIRSAEDFYRMSLLLFMIVIALLPFALAEAITGRNILLSLFSSIYPSHIDSMLDYVNFRWGMKRVQASFDHPILFGVFTGSTFALVYLVLGYGKSRFGRLRKGLLVVTTAFLSLSAGPLSALAAQMLLIVWDGVLKHISQRWKILWGVMLAMYALVATVSNQSVAAFYLTHFSFDEGSAYYRLLIWNFGSATALNHPLFGVGLGEWERPSWMPPSIDMFWLYNAVRYGIPAGFLMMFAFVSIVWSVGFRKGLPREFIEYQKAYLFVMIGFLVVGWTVHFWNATYVFFTFFIGSGIWLLDVEQDIVADASEKATLTQAAAMHSRRTSSAPAAPTTLE